MNKFKLDPLLKPILEPMPEQTVEEQFIERWKEEELIRKERDRLFLVWELAMRNPWVFMTNFVYTMDPHAKGGKVVKLFPSYKYLRWLTQTWERERLLLVSKSRQMLISWLFVGLYVWDSMAHYGRFTFFQSKKEDDAGFTNTGATRFGLSLCSRAEWIWNHLPEAIKLQNPITTSKKPPLMTFSRTMSVIQGISQDSEAPRQYTATGFLGDELAFQERAERGVTAAIPTLDTQGRYTGVSSANGKNFFYLLLQDRGGE